MGILKKRPGLGALVMLGFMLGVLCGVFFGEIAGILDPVGRAYIRLLQMAIIPYIMVSLIAGLGQLTPVQASRIAIWGGAVLLLILAAGMVLVVMVPLSYPDWASASYFSSSLLNSAATIDFVSLYISANPFNSLANTMVPAVVLFSIMMGVAVMMSQKKAPLLEILSSLDEALMNISRFVVKLAPIGIFAIAASAAGTLDLTAFGKLQVFVWSYLLLWAILFFVLLPGLLVALTPIGYGEIFKTFRIPLVTSFVSGSVLVVLPMVIEGIRELLKTHGIGDPESDASVDVLIPTTFNFPSVAMLLVLSFILFAGWYSGAPLPLDQYPMFSSVGLFVAFGGSNIALPFLLDLFRLPADMFQLFLVANVITNFFFMALSTMNLVVLTILAIFFIKDRIKVRPLALSSLLVTLVIGTPLLLKGSGMLIDEVIPYQYSGYQEFVARKPVGKQVPVRSAQYRSELAAPGKQPGRLDRVAEEGWLRVGYASDALPWVFRNDAGEYVGYDMELLHRLAFDLGVNLELMLVKPDQIVHALETGQIDLFASGLMIDAAFVRQLELSEPYGEVTLGLLAPDYRRRDFETIEQLRNSSGSSLAVLQSPSLLRALEVALPQASLRSVGSPRQFLEGELPDVNGLIMPAEAASAWTLVYPEFSAVIPARSDVRIPIVLALPRGDTDFSRYVNTWIQTARALGLTDAAYQHWILGRDETLVKPRWSVIRDVLHWVD